ncbi:MAG TPA: carboxypeptidase-like regulatory domain-containing protein, partial [Gemmatimonadaceae bacterium]
MRRTLVTLAMASALAGGALRPGHAQEVRGTLRESVTRQPIRGAVVLLLDSGGRALGRNITDEQGRYRIVVSPNTTQLRFLRIGFRPATVPLVRRSDAVDTVDVLMTTLPTMLEPVAVRASGCPRRDDAGQALGLLEQARASLLNSVVAREANAGKVVRIRFQRMMAGMSDRITSQTVKMDSTAKSERPFVSARTGAEFVRDGFVKEDMTGQVVYAPDADALLDDGFMAGYCMRLVRGDRDHRTEVGLGFTTPKHAPKRVDIDGVLWVDTTQRQLRRLEFHYVGLDRSLEPANPGGWLTFREMVNGVVIIDRWSLHLPAIRWDSVYDGHTRQFTRRDHLEAQESGGEVGHISWPTGLAWDAPLGTLVLTALTHSHAPAAGALVRLEDTDYSGRADAKGQVTLTRLLPGPYNLVVIDTLLEPLGVTLRTPVKFDAVRDSTRRETVEVSSAQDYVADRCRHDGIWIDVMPRKRPHAVWMIGRVIGHDGVAV